MAQNSSLYRVTTGFAVPGPDGVLVSYPAGTLLRGSDSLVRSHAAHVEPADNRVVEQATAAPGERRSLRLPSGVRLRQAVEHNTGHAHKTGADPVAHLLPPEHEDSPASTFAPDQPAAGVVADDVPDEQNKAGAPKASDVSGSADDGKGDAKSSKRSR